jgi:hypothetical protein
MGACSLLNPWPKPAGYAECHRTQEGKCQNIVSAYEESLKSGSKPVPTPGKPVTGEIPATPTAAPRAGEEAPLRRPGKVLRVEIRPYVDDKGRWHGGENIFMEVEKPRWIPR